MCVQNAGPGMKHYRRQRHKHRCISCDARTPQVQTAQAMLDKTAWTCQLAPRGPSHPSSRTLQNAEAQSRPWQPVVHDTRRSFYGLQSPYLSLLEVCGSALRMTYHKVEAEFRGELPYLPLYNQVLLPGAITRVSFDRSHPVRYVAPPICR